MVTIDAPPGAEKRAHIRYPLFLQGRCTLPTGAVQAVEIRDFCLGGMLLVPRASGNAVAAGALSHGVMVTIQCAVPGESGLTALHFTGRVVHSHSGAVGLAFIDPQAEALRLLEAFATKENIREQPARGIPAPSANRAAATLLAECKKIAGAALAPLARTFLNKVVEDWFELAGRAQTAVDKNAYYDAVSVFKRKSDGFEQAFIAGMVPRLTAYAGRDGSENTTPRAAPAVHELSLVEEDAFEEWLAFSDVARRVEEDCQEPLLDLKCRFEALLNTTPDKDSNPFWPAAFCRSFQAALRPFQFDSKVQKAAYSVFKETLSAHASTLYADLNQYLVEQGVMPDLRHKYQIKRSPAGSWRRQAAMAATLSGSDALSAQPQPAGVAAPQEWFRIVQELDGLRKQVAQWTLGSSAAVQGGERFNAQSASTAAPAKQTYTQEELLRAFSASQFPVPAALPAQTDIQSQLLAILTQGKPAQAVKALPEHEARILSVADSLFGAVLGDRLVSANVRPWIKQISVPMMKLAIQDNTVLTDRDHLARQVINKLAELEFYGDTGDQSQMVVRKRIAGVLANITQAEWLTPDLLSRVLSELDRLVRIQDKAYLENLNDLIAACEQEQPVNGADVPRDAIAVPEGPDGEAIRAWRRRVQRLRLGDSLLLAREIKPQRIKLGWISPSRDRYVFADSKGLRALVAQPDELARMLHQGELNLLDDGGESPLDRAQYAMLQQMHQSLVHESAHDPLTGLLNRREFEKRLSEVMAQAEPASGSRYMGLIAVDQYGVVNNTFGYDGGDQLLREVAGLLQDALGRHGKLARLDGAEFGVLFEPGALDQTLALIDAFRRHLADYRLVYDNKSLAISFSAGLVPISAENYNIVSLFQEAEASCQIARGKGANVVQVYSADDAGVSRHMQTFKWAMRIDEALDKNTLELRYQAIARIGDAARTVHHCEVLLGVVDEAGKLISPAEFVLAAEYFRRMATVDRWVIARVFRWMAENPAELAQIGGPAINLSGSSLNEDGFADYILEQAQQYQVPMHKVCFEITETAGVANLSNASDFILTVKETGCLFSLDDFGSGLSSYAYLKNLPVDFLKIDGAFIKKMDENPYDHAVVKSITEIGHFMGKQIIAEYVENETVLRMLEEMGVDYAQGYVIARPQNLVLSPSST